MAAGIMGRSCNVLLSGLYNSWKLQFVLGKPGTGGFYGFSGLPGIVFELEILHR